MNSIQIGRFVLNGQLISFLSFGAAGWLMLQYRLRTLPERNFVSSCAASAYWLWFIVWKASYLLFYPTDAIREPVSLLYFDGGERGSWMASLVAAAYIWHRSAKRNIPLTSWLDIGVWFCFGGWAGYHLLLFALGDEPLWFHAGSAGWSAILLVVLLFSRKGLAERNALACAIWFSLGNALLLFFVPSRPLWLLSFSKQQAVLLLIAACLTGWLIFSEKRHQGGPRG